MIKILKLVGLVCLGTTLLVVWALVTGLALVMFA